VDNTVTIEFTNIDGGSQPDQTYVCDGAPAIEGTDIGINGYAGVARIDNFGIPGEMEPGLYLDPEYQAGSIPPGESDDFDMSVLNLTGGQALCNLYYTPTGPGDCGGPASLDPIDDGGTAAFRVTVDMDPGAVPGDVVACEVLIEDVVSGYTDTALIEAEPAFPGQGAYGLDVYPGYQLVQWDDIDVPGVWNLLGSRPEFHPAGDFLGDDYYTMYALEYYSNEFVAIDVGTNTRTVIGYATPTGNWTGMTGTADGSTLYASSSDCGVESYLYEIDPATGALTLIGPMRAGSCMIDIAINAAGEMYGVDIVDDSLYMIDTATGAATYIGSTGASANYAQGLDFDCTTGTLYWAAYTSSGEMRTIDTGTGMSTLVGGFPGGNEVDCLAIVGGEPPEDTIHVEAIDGYFSMDYMGRPILRSYVYVADDEGSMMPFVMVDAAIWVPDGGPHYRSRFTKYSGAARFHWGSWTYGDWELCVDGLTLAGYTYAPGDNVITCQEWYY
jgi:hypothetical protein